MTGIIERSKDVETNLEDTVNRISKRLHLTPNEKKAYNDSIAVHPQNLWGVINALTFVAHTNPLIQGHARQEEIETVAWEYLERESR